jgi:hypothetical protein
MSQDGKAAGPYIKRTLEERAALNDELGFYPANLDEESIAEYRREDSEDRERHARWVRKHGCPKSSHWNQFRHLVKNREPRL